MTAYNSLYEQLRPYATPNSLTNAQLSFNTLDEDDDDDDETIILEREKEAPTASAVYDAVDKEWRDLQRDCSAFPALTDAVYGTLAASAAAGSHNHANKSCIEVLGTPYTPKGSSSNSPSYVGLRNWTPPEELAARSIQARYGRNRAFYVSTPQGSLSPPSQTPTSTPRLIIRGSSHLDVLGTPGSAQMATPTPLPRNRIGRLNSSQVNSRPSINASKPSSSGTSIRGLPAEETRDFSSHMKYQALPQPSSSTPLPTYPAREPGEVFQPDEILEERYFWIAAGTKQNINAQVKMLWKSLQDAGEHDEEEKKYRVLANLRSLSNQVLVQERRFILRTHSLPRVWDWLKTRQMWPPGSKEHATATGQIEEFKKGLIGGEVQYVQECLQKMMTHGPQAVLM